MRWAIVSDKIETFYESDVKVQYGGEWGSMNHVPVPDTLDWTTVSWNGSELIEDPLKIQAKLDAAWTQLRAERNRRLAASDWTQLLDTHLSQDAKASWSSYRQELRDLPDEVTDPTQVEWPLDPTQVAQVAPTGSRLDGILTHVGVEPVVEAPVVSEPEPVSEAEPVVTGV